MPDDLPKKTVSIDESFILQIFFHNVHNTFLKVHFQYRHCLFTYYDFLHFSWMKLCYMVNPSGKIPVRRCVGNICQSNSLNKCLPFSNIFFHEESLSKIYFNHNHFLIYSLIMQKSYDLTNAKKVIFNFNLFTRYCVVIF